MKDSVIMLSGGLGSLSPFGSLSPETCPSVKSFYSTLGGYRVLQDQARPELAVLFDKNRVGEVSIGVVKSLPMLAYRSEFTQVYGLHWVKETRTQLGLYDGVSVLAGRSTPVQYTINVTTNDRDAALAVYTEQSALNNSVLLRLCAGLTHTELQTLPVEMIPGFKVGISESGSEPEYYLVSNVTDEIIGEASLAANPAGIYAVKLVTAEAACIEAALAISIDNQ